MIKTLATRGTSIRNRGVSVLNYMLPNILKLKQNELKNELKNELNIDSREMYFDNQNKDPSKSNKLKDDVHKPKEDNMKSELYQKSALFEQTRKLSHSSSDTTFNSTRDRTQLISAKKRSTSDYFDLKTKHDHFKIWNEKLNIGFEEIHLQYKPNGKPMHEKCLNNSQEEKFEKYLKTRQELDLLAEGPVIVQDNTKSNKLLSLHKLSPIPSVESDDAFENESSKHNLNISNKPMTKISSDVSVSSAKGILKKCLESTTDDISTIIAPSEQEIESETTNRLDIIRKEGIGARMVKFEMSSLDSENSDEMMQSNATIKTNSQAELKSKDNTATDVASTDTCLTVFIVRIVLDVLKNLKDKKHPQTMNIDKKEFVDTERFKFENMMSRAAMFIRETDDQNVEENHKNDNQLNKISQYTNINEEKFQLKRADQILNIQDCACILNLERPFSDELKSRRMILI